MIGGDRESYHSVMNAHLSGEDSSNDPELTAFLEPFVSKHKRSLFDRVLEERTRWLTVVLEDVYQGFNASACLRSCEGFGVQDVHVVERRRDFKPDGQIAVGAPKWLTMHRHLSTPECYADLRERGYRIIATAPREDARPLAELDLDRPAALVFGTEKEGLTAEAIDGADETVFIPMHGFTESLNVSVCVALCLRDLTIRLRRDDTTVDWHLTAEERAIVRAAWIRNAIGYRLPAYERRFRLEREDRLRRTSSEGSVSE